VSSARPECNFEAFDVLIVGAGLSGIASPALRMSSKAAMTT
jgi:cation diffusion facilitator CzcD-associated flavoprotein CzcO